MKNIKVLSILIVFYRMLLFFEQPSRVDVPHAPLNPMGNMFKMTLATERTAFKRWA